MNRTLWNCGLMIAVVAAIALRDVRAADDSELLFVRRVGPLLSEKCVACHGQDAKALKGGLDLRGSVAARNGGDSKQPSFVPGKPNDSPLYLAVTREHDDWSPMPPKEADRLSGEQIGWIRDWIAGGAHWPEPNRQQEIARANEARWSAEDGAMVPTSGGLSAEWTNRKYKLDGLWAYQPVRKPSLAQSGAAAIDALIARRMPEGIVPAPPAEARVFIRRATFDLTGLPPTPEEVAAFQKEFTADADAAVVRLIDRLLESPHYGERMAQHWLDVTRYADSSGFANDYERGNAWRYRDYVVRAFNSDLPYDQFIREQIAGDELAEGELASVSHKQDPSRSERRRSEFIIATGFLRMGPWELTGMEVAKVARQRFLDDVVNSVGETFLAHSLQCARCHDHKFDPIPTRDYYSMQAVFSTTQLTERAAPFLPAENTAGFEERQYLEQRRAEHLATLAELDAVLLLNAQRWFDDNGKDRSRWDDAVTAARRLKTGDKEPGRRREFSDVFSAARGALTRQGVPEADFPPKLVGFKPEEFGRERVARKGFERLHWELERYEPFALSVYNGRTPDMKAVSAPLRIPANRLTVGHLEYGCIHIGGDPFSVGPKVQPGVLSVLDERLPAAEFAIPNSLEGRRLAFANWVASANNPLTTRGIVNRIWLWHFGEPLAGNPNNFGSTGKRPTHPELLDWLAATFVEQAWSFKRLHRAIMQSAAYRRGGVSALAPHERSFAERKVTFSYAYFKPRRLSAEELRDSMLFVSGELNPALGGIPNRPEINLEAALQPRQVMGTFAAAWVPNPKPEQRHRRSLYALKLRGLSDPAMVVFNAPAPDFSCERRETSTVTPQVFALFNSQASHTRALALAARVLKETKTDDAAIHRAVALAHGRPAKPNELAACLAHWREMQAVQSTLKFATTKPPLEVRRDAIEENTGENFSFHETLHANAAFVPDLQSADCDARTRALADVCLALLNTNEFAYVD